MESIELGTLENVPVRNIWSHEAHGFTPWLADNLSQLGRAVSLETLEFVKREHWMPGSGYVDILAKDGKSECSVVIENQLEQGDDSHFVRLISYAANSEAKILIWVASGFGKYHLDMLNWLNAQGLSVFAVKVAVYRIGENYAPWFEVVVSPDDEANLVGASATGQPNLYGRFYSPLTAELRREGILAVGGRQGGWSGRWRMYRAGKILDGAGISYVTTLGLNTQKCSAGLLFHNGRNEEIAKAILDRRDDLTAKLDDLEVVWEHEDIRAIVFAENPPLAEEDDATLEETRQWMRKVLVQLHGNIRPKVEEIMRGLE